MATISSLGIRGPVPSVPRPAGQERILVLGDSTFFGYGVDDEGPLSAHIRRLDSTGTDTVNAGVPGYSIQQARLLMDDVGWDTQPSLVLIGCFWSDTKLAAYPDRDLLNSRAAGRSPLLRSSALVRLIAGRLRVGGIVSWTRFDELPGPDQRRVPVREYASALDALVREAATRGIGTALITPPVAILVTGGVEPPHHWDPYLRAQAVVAAHHGIPHIQTTAAFIAHYEQAVAASSGPIDNAQRDARGQLFLDDLHPSALGQALMAQVTLDGLREAGWPQARLLGTGQGEMAVDGLEDGDVRGEHGPSNRVPMANLFPHGNIPPPEGLAVSMGEGEPGPNSDWVVHGDARVARGGEGCRVKLVTESGHTVASATLLRTGTYRFKVSATEDRVEVILRGTLCAGKGQATRESGGRVRLSPQDP